MASQVRISKESKKNIENDIRRGRSIDSFYLSFLGNDKAFAEKLIALAYTYKNRIFIDDLNAFINRGKTREEFNQQVKIAKAKELKASPTNRAKRTNRKCPPKKPKKRKKKNPPLLNDIGRKAIIPESYRHCGSLKSVTIVSSGHHN